MEKRITSHSERETRTVAQELIEKYVSLAEEKPLVILLYGDLGAGKTIFMKEIGRSLGIDQVVSPAFVVYYEYPLEKDGLKYLYHFDLYRITEPDEFDHLGIEDILKPGNIIAIEWSEKSEPIQRMLHERGNIVEVYIKHEKGDTRNITVIEPKDQI